MKKILDEHLVEENTPPKESENEIDLLLFTQCSFIVMLLASAWLSMEGCIVLNIFIAIVGGLLVTRALVFSKGHTILALGIGQFWVALLGTWWSVKEGYWLTETAVADFGVTSSLVITGYGLGMLATTIFCWMKWANEEGRH